MFVLKGMSPLSGLKIIFYYLTQGFAAGLSHFGPPDLFEGTFIRHLIVSGDMCNAKGIVRSVAIQGFQPIYLIALNSNFQCKLFLKKEIFNVSEFIFYGSFF